MRFLVAAAMAAVTVPLALAPLASADPVPGPPYVDHVQWAKWGDLSSLRVYPTESGRRASLVATTSAADEAWAEVLTLSPDANMPGMRHQFMCHWELAELAQPGKISWNLEPWRNEVSDEEMAEAHCNPGGTEEPLLVRRYSRESVAALVDHTLLKPEATEADVVALLQEAEELGVFAVCVSPTMVATAKSFRTGESDIASVVGFPSGKHLSAIKAEEARLAVRAGADEIDMVIDVGSALEGDFDAVRADIAAVFDAIPDHVILKVIVESAALLALGGEQRLVDVCRVAEDAGADFVKTSTGFHPSGGASVRAVELMASAVGDRLGVKASGGIRTAADAVAMLGAGATRLGLSGTRAVLDGLDDPRSRGLRRPSASTHSGSKTGSPHRYP